MAARHRLAVYARVPEAGKVKTRLIPRFGADGATCLHVAFVADLVARLASAGAWECVVYTAGEGDMAGLGTEGVSLRRQRGADLGERLIGTFAEAQAEAIDATVVVGSDSPDLPVDRIAAAFAALETGDLALGPAQDGGYYLIGLGAPCPALFSGIPWGESGVYSATLGRARAAGLATTLLAPWYDVDRPEDVAILAAHLEALWTLRGEDRAPRTRRLLAEFGVGAS